MTTEDKRQPNIEEDGWHTGYTSVLVSFFEYTYDEDLTPNPQTGFVSLAKHTIPTWTIALIPEEGKEAIEGELIGFWSSFSPRKSDRANHISAQFGHKVEILPPETQIRWRVPEQPQKEDVPVI